MPDYRNINVRSPFFTQKATTGSVVNCEIRLWKGDVVTDLPTDYTYLLSKEPTAGKSTFEIAELARDFLSHNTDLSSGFAWMQIILKDTIVADDTFTYLLSEGYSLSTEGLQSSNIATNLLDSTNILTGWFINPTVTVTDLGSGVYRMATSSSGNIAETTNSIEQGDEVTASAIFEGTGTARLRIQEDGGNFTTYVEKIITLTSTPTKHSVTAFNQLDGNDVLMTITLDSSSSTADISLPSVLQSKDVVLYDFVGLPTATIDGLANSSRIMVADGGTNSIPYYSNSDGVDYTINDGTLAVIPATTTSTTMIKTKSVDENNTTVDFYFNGDSRRVFVDVLRCSKFDAVNLLYVNKLGFKTKFPFILKSTEKISVESDSFSRSTVDYGALTLNTSSHSSRKRIKDTKQSFVLNSDWIAEYYVSQFEELMLSEYVWLEKGYLTLPVNITTSKLDKKTHINDKLINYSIEIETASNYINTIR